MDNDPQPRRIFWPILADDILKATKAMHPEACIPEREMPTTDSENSREDELARQISFARRNIRMALNILDHPIEHDGDRAEIKLRLQRILRETD